MWSAATSALPLPHRHQPAPLGGAARAAVAPPIRSSRAEREEPRRPRRGCAGRGATRAVAGAIAKLPMRYRVPLVPPRARGLVRTPTSPTALMPRRDGQVPHLPRTPGTDEKLRALLEREARHGRPRGSGDLLRSSCPRTSPPVGAFTTRVVHRLDAPARRRSVRALGLAASAGHGRPDGDGGRAGRGAAAARSTRPAAERALAEIRAEHGRLEREVEELSQPLRRVYLGGNEDVDLVLDLGQVGEYGRRRARRLSAARRFGRDRRSSESHGETCDDQKWKSFSAPPPGGWPWGSAVLDRGRARRRRRRERHRARAVVAEAGR